VEEGAGGWGGGGGGGGGGGVARGIALQRAQDCLLLFRKKKNYITLSFHRLEGGKVSVQKKAREESEVTWDSKKRNINSLLSNEKKGGFLIAK